MTNQKTLTGFNKRRIICAMAHKKSPLNGGDFCFIKYPVLKRPGAG
jgi:hypothetical protein